MHGTAGAWLTAVDDRCPQAEGSASCVVLELNDLIDTREIVIKGCTPERVGGEPGEGGGLRGDQGGPKT